MFNLKPDENQTDSSEYYWTSKQEQIALTGSGLMQDQASAALE